MEKCRLSDVKAMISRSLGATGGGEGAKKEDSRRGNLRVAVVVSESVAVAVAMGS